jgi:RNA polymerase sigma-70 factor (ECF subfamily)
LNHKDIIDFDALVRKCQDRVYNLCRYMLRNPEDAQDAAQDTFLKAYRGIKDFKPDAALYTWIYRIAVNTCLDYKRRTRRRPLNESLPEDRPSEAPSPDKEFESRQTGEALQSALQRLPGKLRAAIVMREIEGLSYEEISETLQISVGTVKSRISRARRELRQILLKKIG